MALSRELEIWQWWGSDSESTECTLHGDRRTAEPLWRRLCTDGGPAQCRRARDAAAQGLGTAGDARVRVCSVSGGQAGIDVEWCRGCESAPFQYLRSVLRKRSQHACAAPLQDVYTLAQAYFRAGMHQRAIYTIVEAGLLERPKFRCTRRSCIETVPRQRCSLSPQTPLRSCSRRFLVAKCHVAKENWEEALQVLGESSVRHQPDLRSTLSAQLCPVLIAVRVDQTEADAAGDGDGDYRSSMSLLRGTVPFMFSSCSRLPRHADLLALNALHPVGLRCNGRPRASHRGERDVSLPVATHVLAIWPTRLTTRIGRRIARRCTRTAVVTTLSSILRSTIFSPATRSRHCSRRCAKQHPSS